MKFRFARHTNNLDRLTAFYVKIIGLEVLGGFKDHSGYDGIFLGKKNRDWHLEFTQTKEEVNHLFDEDDLLVFYPETQEEFDALLLGISSNNITRTVAKNPYWRENGISLKDPDGQGIVISSLNFKI